MSETDPFQEDPPARRRATRPDPLTPLQRRRNMQRIRSRDTTPELVLRRALHAAGLRYRLHAAHLPGRPDLVFPRRHAVIFVHGCFWHGHACSRGVMPGSNVDFWDAKIAANRRRDQFQADKLRAQGWRVAVMWECGLVGRKRREAHEIVGTVIAWLASDQPTLEL